ncbi:hypothetical protein PTKIN_Ptkin08bG0205800 [Pterospermum kingtungense]
MNPTERKRNMGEEEILEQRRSLAAPLIFFTVIVFQYATKRLQDLKKGASETDKEIQLREEIKQLLKQAVSFSQPSTFAQAAKLRRLAAAKEKELANYHYSPGGNLLVWRLPVASVSQQLVQPFELIRSLHVYRSENGDETEVEKEFLKAATPLLRLQGFRAKKLSEGRHIGLWLCVFAYHVHRLPPFFFIPSLLSICSFHKFERWTHRSEKKCREFGIPRWPHRKIKSLDGLIRDPEEEAEKRQQEDEAAASAVSKRRIMLETDKESAGVALGTILFLATMLEETEEVVQQCPSCSAKCKEKWPKRKW